MRIGDAVRAEILGSAAEDDNGNGLWTTVTPEGLSGPTPVIVGLDPTIRDAPSFFVEMRMGDPARAKILGSAAEDDSGGGGVRLPSGAAAAG